MSKRKRRSFTKEYKAEVVDLIRKCARVHTSIAPVPDCGNCTSSRLTFIIAAFQDILESRRCNCFFVAHYYVESKVWRFRHEFNRRDTLPLLKRPGLSGSVRPTGQ